MKTLFTIFLLASILTSLEKGFGQSYLSFPIDTLARDSFYNYRAQIKYDDNGFYHIVNSRQFDIQSNTRDIFYWTDVNGSVEKIRVTDNGIDDNYATVSFDTQDNVHIGWERRDAGNLFQVIYANDRVTQGDFSNTVWITAGGINKATPYMTVGRDSTAHFVYYTFVTGQDNAYYKTYNFVTGQLGTQVTLGPGEASGENDIEVAVDGLNKVHIVYTTNATFNGGALKYFNNESGTLTDIPTGLNTDIRNPDITIDDNNTVYIIYKLSSDDRIYMISRPSGGSFTAPVAIVPSTVGNPVFWRGIDTDANGRLYVAYANNSSSATKGFFLVHGTGTSFSEPILVFQDSTGSYIVNGSTSVAAKGNGEIAVTFDPAGSRFDNVISDILLKQGTLVVTNIRDPVTEIKDFKLIGNYPNPFNPSTTIKFNIPVSLREGYQGNRRGNPFVKLIIYNSVGQKISTLVNKELEAGVYEYTFNARDLPSGTYFYTLTAGEYTETKKMLLIK